VLGHPIVIALKRAKAVNKLAANDVSEENGCLFYIGHGKTNVVGSAKRWYALGHFHS
jgi:hypothetical protein